jgi:RNA polymerase sigma-70 factor (ECF subfamily)
LKVSHRQTAEDITHQVFLNAWLNIRGYQNRGFPFSTWLYRIARNKIIDFYRTKRDIVEIDDETNQAVADIVAIDATEAANQAWELENIKKAITKLKPEYQDILIMRFIEDMSIRDIAQIIEKSEGAVKLIQHRALEQLRNIIHKTE